MQALIDFIIRNLLWLWPIARVYEWQTAFMVRRGKIQRALGPGLHWRWWGIDEVKTWAGTEVVINLPTCAVTTADGVPIALDGNLGYVLEDMRQCWRTVWSLDASLKALAQGVMCTAIAQTPWTALAGAGRIAVEDQLLAKIATAFAPWGTKATRFHLVACVPAKQHRHFVDGTLAR